jgi:predicted deacylase
MRWLVKKGDTVRKGDEICSVKKLGGNVETHKAPCDGIVKKIHGQLQAEDELDARLSEKTLAVIDRFKIDKLKLSHGGTRAAVAQSGTFFVKYTVKLYELVHEGAVVAITQGEGGLPMKVRSTAQGFVLALQEQITVGDPVELVPDRNLAVIGHLPALQIQGRQVPIIAPVGTIFARWHHMKADFVEKGEPVCFVRNTEGREIPVLAPRDGMLHAIQQNLPQGKKVDVAVPDRILATLGPLPPLEVPLGEAPTFVPLGSGWLFDSWRVKLGSQVTNGDIIAVVRHVNGSTCTVHASKDGMVNVMQQHLQLRSNL